MSMDKFLFPLIVALCSESDVFSNTLTEIEWNPATKLLSQVTSMNLTGHYPFTLLSSFVIGIYCCCLT